MSVTRTPEALSLKLSLNYGPGEDGKNTVRSRTYGDLKLDAAPDAVMQVVKAIGTLIEPVIEGQKLVATDGLKEIAE